MNIWLQYPRRIRFRKLSRPRAHAECRDCEISINLMTGANPAHSAIHEVLHYLHDDWSETRVVRETTKIWRKLDTKQRYDLYHWLFNHKFRG